jgi:alpha-tubulin suppressor-like RCC1 family protein
VDFYQGAAGSYTNFLAIMKDTTVRTLGHSPINSSGTSQNTTFEQLLTTPTSPVTPVTNAVDIISIGGRYGSCYAIRTSDGKVYVIGYTSKGQKGIGTTDQGATPAICQPAVLPPVEQLVMNGYAHEGTTDTVLIARCTNGETYQWGYNGNYNLADGTSNNDIYAPTQVKF